MLLLRPPWGGLGASCPGPRNLASHPGCPSPDLHVLPLLPVRPPTSLLSNPLLLLPLPERRQGCRARAQVGCRCLPPPHIPACICVLFVPQPQAGMTAWKVLKGSGAVFGGVLGPDGGEAEFTVHSDRHSELGFEGFGVLSLWLLGLCGSLGSRGFLRVTWGPTRGVGVQLTRVHQPARGCEAVPLEVCSAPAKGPLRLSHAAQS